MNTLGKIAGAAVLTGALALAAAKPGQARDWHGGGAAAAGFAAGAVVGAAAASSYNNGYYYGDYAYDRRYAPGYAYDSGYAYEPAPSYYEPAPAYGYRYYNNSQGPGCTGSPASQNYTSCN